jgi:hypothetical protein
VRSAIVVKSVENALSLEPGDRLKLGDGTVAEVTENPQDGVWLFCTVISSPDESLAGAVDHPIYATDVVSFAE